MATNHGQNIITLTTDMGTIDYYVGALKGEILSRLPEARIVDISHHIKAFKIAHAAFVIRNCMYNFPKNTVHIIGVDTEPLINFRDDSKSIYPTIIRYNDQYFIGADNGIFSLLIGNDSPEEIWRMDDVLSHPDLMIFPTKNIFVPAACKIISGENPKEFCTPSDSIRKAILLSPVLDNNVLRGVVQYIDHYENIITNITKTDFERVGSKVPFTIYFRKKEYYIDKISNGYNEVTPGEKVALFNDGGFLEIAINKGALGNGGGAKSLLGLEIGSIIRIEFTPRGSRTTLDSLF